MAPLDEETITTTTMMNLNRRDDALDQLEVMLAQESSDAYRTVDYLGTTTRKRQRPSGPPMQPPVPLAAQRAAVEEVAAFIGSLTLGEDGTFGSSSASHSSSSSTEGSVEGHENGAKKPGPSFHGGGRISPASVASPLPLAIPASDKEEPTTSTQWPSFRGLPFSRRGSATASTTCTTDPSEDQDQGPEEEARAQQRRTRQDQPPALRRWRRQMTEWSLRAVDAFGFSRRTVLVSMSLVDRYLSSLHLSSAESECDKSESPRPSLASSTPLIAKDDFQLLTMTALYVSIKALEPFLKLSADAVADMSGGAFLTEDVLEQELALMEELGWRMNGPTCADFAERFVDVLKFRCDGEEDSTMRQRCQYTCELAVVDGELVGCHPSSVGLAAVILSLEDCYEHSDDTIDDMIDDLEEQANLDIDEDELVLCLDRLRTAGDAAEAQARDETVISGIASAQFC